MSGGCLKMRIEISLFNVSGAEEEGKDGGSDFEDYNSSDIPTDVPETDDNQDKVNFHTPTRPDPFNLSTYLTFPKIMLIGA